MSTYVTMKDCTQQKTKEKPKFPRGDVLIMIMSFLQLVEKAVVKTVCKEFDEACKCPDSYVGVLDLEGIHVNKFKRILTSMPKRTFVEDLILSRMHFKKEDSLPFEMFREKFPKLQQLDLSCTYITDHTLARMSWMPLKYLNLSGCRQITDAGLAHLNGMQQLTELDLMDCEQITNAALTHLTGLPLEFLSLPLNIEITDNDIQHLPITLKSISSFGSEITDAGLAQLARLTSLYYLNLYKCQQITHAGLRSLANLKLTHLILGDATDQWLKYLSHMRLVELCLGNCTQLTDAGIKYLSHMPLKILMLKGCRLLTDESMSVIKDLPLKYLDLSGCRRITSRTLMMHIPKMHLDEVCVRGIYFKLSDMYQFKSSTAPTRVEFGSSEDDEMIDEIIDAELDEVELNVEDVEHDAEDVEHDAEDVEHDEEWLRETAMMNEDSDFEM